MCPRKAAMLGAAMLAVASFGAAEEARAQGGWSSGNAHYCLWYKQKAMRTGDEYWWGRWRRCLRGYDWD